MLNPSHPTEHATTITVIEQDFLQTLVQKKSLVAVYLKNGIKLKGVIAGFDEDSVILDHPSVQLVLKSAISTIAPLINFYAQMPPGE